MKLYLRLFVYIMVICAMATSAFMSCKPSQNTTGIIDDIGRSVEISSIPKRIVSLAPSNTEILFSLGLGDRVVGVSDFCNYPDDVNTRTKLPDGTANKIMRVGSVWPGFNIESITALKPDLIIGFGYSQPAYVQQLENLGFKLIILGPENINEILSDIEMVGKVTGTETRAKQLTGQMTDRIELVAQKTALAVHPKVFFEIDGTDPGKPWTVGPGSFVNDLIRIAGGDNIGSVGTMQGFQISTEEIVKANPDIIVLADVMWGVTVQNVAARTGWSNIEAVKNNKIYDIDPDITSRDGPRIVDALDKLLKIIHPEITL